MLQDIPKLGSSDPKVSKAAALSIITHVSQNKGELEYLVKRLVNGLESVRIPTRSGCYSTLAALLGLRIVDPFHLFDLMQKALITNKQSTKKERRLIYIARILCTGVIYRTSQVADLSKDQEFLKASLTGIVDLSNKKSNYFQLATPFLSHLLQDTSLTQENFDTNVWPSFTPFFEGKAKKRKEEDADEDEEEEEEETGTSDILCCKVLLALLCKNGGYKEEFECLKDAKKIAKSLLTCRIEFASLFLGCLFKHLSGSDEESTKDFWTAIVDNIKPTQFDLLCLCVEKAVEAKIPVSTIVSKKLVTHLLSVFKQKDVEFHGKARKTIGLLLNWGKTKEECAMGKKQRKTVIRVLFGEDSPNLLDEYKHLHMVIRPFLNSLKPRDLGTLHRVITTHLETPGLGIRMTITYLQFLGKIGQARNVNHEICFEIGKRLLNIALGQEKLVVKMKVQKERQEEEEEEESDDEVTEEDAQEQVKQATLECVKTILSSTYDFEFMNLLSEYVVENYKELTSDPETLKIIKKIKKTQKKFENQHFKYVLSAYGIRVLLDETQVLKTANETTSALIEMSKGIENEEELTSELIKFILTTVLREPHPAFNYEGMFNKLIIEGQVKEDVIQAFADAIDVQVEEGEEEEDSDDESLADEEVEKLEKQLNGIEDASGSEEEDDDEEGETAAPPPKKKAKNVEAKASKEKNDDEHGSDSEESIDMDEATEEELKSMNTALARVFAVKKSMKDEQHGEVRAMMRTLKLIEIYIQRNSKSMHVSALLILLMPIIHSLQNSLKMRKNNGITTKVIGVLDNINRIKKFAGSDDAVEGTLASIAVDLYQMANEKKNKLIRELLEHSVILVTKCFLQKSQLTKKENKRFIELYVNAAGAAKSKLKKRKIVKRKGKVPVLQTSRFVRLALDTLPDWPAGKQAIEKKVKGDQ
ncbi:hypothetical protein Ocin01_05090 [Orchesella cincta]|uniref:DNA polymerase V n=1 Tax=Orchesella cincta TaxID=48709 RepID=A0A1D2N8P3_ORCCI|nr:hypothetical protein Ocin01_05090 [Orchesella cincta]